MEEEAWSWRWEGSSTVRKARVTVSEMSEGSTRSRAREGPLVRKRRMHKSTENN